MMTPKQLKPPSLSSTQSGFTLIECLIAIMVVSILMVGIAPAIVVSVATRVQARRLEQATEAARAYIAGVQTGTINQPLSIAPIAQTSVPGNNVSAFVLSGAAQAQASQAPSPTLNCPLPTGVTPPPSGYYCNSGEGAIPQTGTPSVSTTSLYCINLSGTGCNSSTSEGKRNFIVQAFRSVNFDENGNVVGVDGTQGYLLGVRVYRVDAFDGSGALKTTPATGNKRTLSYAGGTGDRKAPVVEMTTEVSTAETTLDSLKQRLGETQSTTGGGT
jgi:prepilin-type N-terminal cleavage/methylation domain-containing protein